MDGWMDSHKQTQTDRWINRQIQTDIITKKKTCKKYYTIND